jgi:uncharacterized sulfatase
MKTLCSLLILAIPLLAGAESFKETYGDCFPVGTAISYAEIQQADPQKLGLILDNFSVITAENAFKWDAIHPEEGRYDFERADRVAAFAKENGMQLWGHVLVWHYQVPDWVFKDGDADASRELILERMREHIHTVMTRYKDVIYGWDVVNEALSDKEGEFLHDSKWLELVGEDFIEQAFRFAMAADPDTLLAYNDYSLPDPPKREKLVKLVKGLLAKGIRVDVVGFQSHYNLYYPELDELEKSIHAVRALGPKVAVSEIDMSVFEMDDKSNRYKDGLPRALELYQGLRYARLMDFYRKHSESIERVTFWGIFDERNWRNYWPVEGRVDYAGLIDRQGKPKAAYYAVMNPAAYLEKFQSIEVPISPHEKETEAAAGGDPARPDIFFYLADDQNYWDYGFAGNPAVQTPNADRLAAEGTLFARAYTSMAICAPSRSSLYTGLYPARNGCYMNHIPARKGIRSVAHYLKDLGYTVVLAGKSHVKPDSVFDWSEYWPLVDDPASRKGILPLDKVRRFLAEKDGPVCIFFASDLPHGPYPDMAALEESGFHPRAFQANNGRTRKRTAGYYENIRRDDHQLGSLVGILKETGNWDQDVFIYASDHGIDGKFSTYDRGLRVPLVVRWKGHARAGAEIPALVHFVDVLPTLVEIAGGDPDNNLDGRSLLPLLSGEAEGIHEAVYGLQTCQNIQQTRIFPGRSITTDRYKLAVNFNALEALPANLGDNQVVNAFLQMGAEFERNRKRIELYDLSSDPFELENLAGLPEHEETRNRLLLQLFEWMQQQGDFITPGQSLPLLKPTLHPLDKSTRFKKVPAGLEGKLDDGDYIPSHY